VCSLEHTIQACVFYRTHTLLSIHLDILNPHMSYFISLINIVSSLCT
jgi:hypothetical protein